MKWSGFTTYAGLTALAVTALILNIAYWQQPLLGLIGGGFFIFYFGRHTGELLWPREKNGWRLILGTFFFMALMAVAGTSLFYLHRFDNISIGALIIAAPALIAALKLWRRPAPVLPSTAARPKAWPAWQIILTTVWALLEAILVFQLSKSVTGEAIRSPWSLIPGDFFIVYFLATLFVIGLTVFGRKTPAHTAIVMLHVFISATVALCVYRLGYGFDPFIHRATEKLIWENGLVTPKPFYYVGQYVWVVLWSKILTLPLELIDLVLVPLLFAIYVPATVVFSFLKITSRHHLVPVLALTVLMFPFSAFIVTTPQGLANLCILLMVFMMMPAVLLRQTGSMTAGFILMLTSLSIHPLAGIPAVIFYGLVAIVIFNPRAKTMVLLKTITLTAWVAITSLCIPLVFLLNSFFSRTLATSLSLNFLSEPEQWRRTFENFIPAVNNNFHLILDIVYWYEANLFILFVILALGGAYILTIRNKIRSALLYLAAFAIIFVNYCGLKLALTFPTLVDYEQANYPRRILEIAFYFLMPLILYLALYAIVWSLKRYRIMTYGIMVFLALTTTASLYISYPRADAYHLDRGYNLTQSDINSVRYIDASANGDYIVLANQMTSVAAIREFGFNKYFASVQHPEKKHFYYPIPTGDPLYQYYLDMVYIRPTKKTAQAAGDLVGVKQVYLVLNSYWDEYDRLVEEAKQEADAFQSIDLGKSHVFYYNLEIKQP